MDSVEKYFRELKDIRNSGEGAKETSFYPALSTLLNDVGRTLRPRVKAILPIRNRGAGMPDGGFFTPEQLRRRSEDEIAVVVPSRGALEAKAPCHDIDELAASEQVGRYLDRYRQVLLTNYREFLLVAIDRGQVRQFERLSLTSDEAGFWRGLQDPQALAAAHGEPLIEYLKRAMTRQAQIATPEDLSWLLASYAREANFRITGVELPALLSLRTSLESALGIKFEGPKGEHFFRSTLIQTLFYGIFSAWVLWVRSEGPQGARFNWREAAWYLQVPLMRALFEQVSMPGRLLPLRLVELLDWTAESLDRVDVPSFFSKFAESEAVQYFYEPFLRNFDPELRRQLGVWYTPNEVVRYMVARVDDALRNELGIPDGLANNRVFVLDPACGTGAYLVEVLRRIESTLRRGNDDALVGDDVREAASKRLFGFELLPAPFVVAHLQIGLLLQQFGAAGSRDHHEAHRPGVFLTNSLTGWAPPTEVAKKRFEQLTLAFPELREEHDSAQRVKQDSPILVIIGNPPYNGFAGVSPEEEQGLVQPYKDGLADWGITKNYLDDLYVRFYRIAERKIAEMNGRGIIAYISNFSFLSQPSFVMMRDRLLREFDSITIDSMNGDSRITGKRTPDGQPDPSVFSTDYNREGIQVGTAVCVLVKSTESHTPARVTYRDFWGAKKRAELLESLEAPSRYPYQELSPTRENAFAFVPRREAACFSAWPDVTELAESAPSLGLNENRRQALIDTDRSELARRMTAYFDPDVAHEQLSATGSGLMMKAARFDPQLVRDRALRGAAFDDAKIRRFVFRPFDFRWAYIETTGKLWNEARRDLVEQSSHGRQEFLYVRCHAPRAADGAPTYFSASLGDQHALHKDAYLIPFWLYPTAPSDQGALFGGAAAPTSTCVANISARARQFLSSLNLDPDQDGVLIWFHTLALTFSPRYVAENADAVRFGWPRVPLPTSSDQLRASAALGRRVATLLDSDEPLSDLHLRFGAITSARPDGSLRIDEGDLAVTAGWGHLSNGATMPGLGKVLSRAYSAEENEVLSTGANRVGMTPERLAITLGESTVDVFLNDYAFWKNVPASVWAYTVGGYQVLKKWLSYREEPILRRSLMKQEARSFGNIAARIAALLLMEHELDLNYQLCSAQTWDWQNAATPSDRPEAS